MEMTNISTPGSKSELAVTEDTEYGQYEYEYSPEADVMKLKSYEVLLMEYPEYRMHKALMLYVPPILVALGTIGNLLTVLIMSRKCMRKNAIYIYLAVLAMADTVVIYIGLLRLWVGELTGHDLRDSADWLCKVINVFGYTASDYSVWLIIAVTVERFIVVCFPLKVPNMCQGRRALGVVTAVFLTLFMLNIHFVWTVEIVYFEHEGKLIPQCAGGDSYRYMVENVWSWVDAFVYSFIPCLVILILNSLIIRQVIRAKKLRGNMTPEHNQFSRPKMERRPSSNYQDSGRLTIMLLCISFTFLVTTLPLLITLIPTSFWTTDDEEDTKHIITLRLIQTITELLMYLNHSINFYLYCATGRKFRQQLCKIFCRRWSCKRRRRTPDPSPWRLSLSTTNQHALMVRLQELDGLVPRKESILL